MPSSAPTRRHFAADAVLAVALAAAWSEALSRGGPGQRSRRSLDRGPKETRPVTDTPLLPDPEPVAPTPRRSSGRIIALAVAIVAVIGGAAFAAVSLANNGNSP